MLRDIAVGDRPVTRERLIEEIRAFLRRVGVEEAILYGSHARGNARRHSDADLILISPQFEGVRVLDRIPPLHQEWEILWPYLQALAYTPEEFERARQGLGIERVAARDRRQGGHPHHHRG